MNQKGFQLGAENPTPVWQLGVVKGLPAEAIAREEQGPPVAVPQREGKHAAEARYAGCAPLLPAVHDDLGIAARSEGVSTGGKLLHELLEIVDLAVEHDGHAAVLVVERLLSRREVDDGEAPVSQRQTRLQVHAARVGAAMKQGRIHALDQAAIDRTLVLAVEYPRDAAHDTSAPCAARVLCEQCEGACRLWT